MIKYKMFENNEKSTQSSNSSSKPFKYLLSTQSGSIDDETSAGVYDHDEHDDYDNSQSLSSMARTRAKQVIKPIKYGSPAARTNQQETNLAHLVVIFLVMSLFVFLVMVAFFFTSSEMTQYSCSGRFCQDQVCSDMINRRVASPLCFEICVSNSIPMDTCTILDGNSNLTYNFFQDEKSESTLMCPYNVSNQSYLQNDLTIDDFEKTAREILATKIFHEPMIDQIYNRLFMMADVNKDSQLNLAEAGSIYSLLTNKHTLYILALTDKSYAPKILNNCGALIEIEKLVKFNLFKNDKSIIGSIFPHSYKWSWPDWSFRAKISLGILEFFLDANTYNPYDEFGKDSLYLCSSIESSFGHTFTYDAKLINYEHLMSASELESLLSDRECKSDDDCAYGDGSMCTAKCNKQTFKCTGWLVKSQLVSYCSFLRHYLLDNKNLTSVLVPLLDRCESTLHDLHELHYVTADTTLLNSRYRQINDLPLSGQAQNDDEFERYMSQKKFLNSSFNYATLTNELQNVLWQSVRYVKDPVKRKQKAGTKANGEKDQRKNDKK